MELDAEEIGELLFEAFNFEALTLSINYTPEELRTYWTCAGEKMAKHSTLAATSAKNGEIVGVACLEELDLSEIQELRKPMTFLDPIDFALRIVRRSFWAKFLETFQGVPVHTCIYRLSFLGVKPCHFGKGIAGKLMDEVHRVFSSNDGYTNVIYSESSVNGTQKILSKRNWDEWGRFKYEDLRREYGTFVTNVSAKENIASIASITEPEYLERALMYPDEILNHTETLLSIGMQDNYKIWGPIESVDSILLQVIFIS